MARIGLLADIHLANHAIMGGPKVAGVNRRCRLILGALADALEKAEVEGCEEVVILGDLFDTVRPSPQVIAATQAVLAGRPELPVKIIAGNHDVVSIEPGDHALGPLGAIEGVEVIDRPERVSIGGAVALLIPFQPRPPAEWLRAAIEVAGGGEPADLLCLHLGVADAGTAFFLRGSSDSIEVDALAELMSEFEIGSAYLGNWHEPRDWPRQRIHQVGTLCPTGFSDAGGNYGSLQVFDTASRAVERHEIPGPRFWNLDYPFLPPVIPGHHFIRTEVPADQLPAAQAEIDRLIKAGVIEDGRATAGEDVGAAPNAIAALGATLSTEDEIRSFVSEMPLPEGVDRDRVVAAALEVYGGKIK